MENAVDALMTAGSVLLLIVALTVSISSFSSLKSQVDDIITLSEQTELAQDEEGNYINYIQSADDIRTVGVEIVISSIRRLRRENYNVYIYSPTIAEADEIRNNDLFDNILVDSDSVTEAQYYAADTSSPIIEANTEYLLQFTLSGSGYSNINNDVLSALSKIIKDNNLQFKEYLGIYQIADTIESVSSSNKTTYRIITYVEE